MSARPAILRDLSAGYIEINNNQPTHPLYYPPPKRDEQYLEVADGEYDIETLIQMVPNHEQYRIAGTAGNYINLAPVGHGYTCLHNKYHDGTHGQCIMLSKRGNVVSVMLYCRSCKISDKIGEFRTGVDDDEKVQLIPLSMSIDRYTREYSSYIQRCLSDNNKRNSLDVTVEDLSSLNCIDWKNRCICIKSACGTGKTKLVNAYLKSLPPGTSILSLTFRRTLAEKQKKDHEGLGFTHYENSCFLTNNRKAGMIRNDPSQSFNPAHRVICQVDSLWRVQGHYDIIILDELEYKLGHLIDFVRNKPKSWSNLREFIKDSTQTIAMDALYSDMSHDFLVSCEKDPWVLINHHPRQQDKTLRLVLDGSGLISLIETALSRGENAVIPTNTKGFAEALGLYLRKKYPQLAMLLITSDTVKRDGFPDSDTWDRYQVLIYTPSVTAGISFEKKHFHSCFCYFTNMSGSAGGALQQMFRVRHLSSGNVYLYVHKSNLKPKLLPVESSGNLEQVKSWMRDKKTMELQRAFHITNGLNNSIDSLDVMIQRNCITGTVMEDPFFHLFCQYTLQKNKSRRDFLRELLFLLKTTQGCLLSTHVETSVFKEIDDLMKIARKEVKSTAQLETINARIVLPVEVEEKKVTQAEYEKFILMEKLAIPDSKISVKVLNHFNKPEVFKHKYRLDLISDLRDADELNVNERFTKIATDIQSKIKDDIFSQLDESRTTIPSKLLTIMTIIQHFGFVHPFDLRRINPNSVQWERLYNYLRSPEVTNEHEKFFYSKMRHIDNHDSHGPNGFSGTITRYINSLLEGYLGLTIGNTGGRGFQYKISGLDSWKWDPVKKHVANWELFQDVRLPLPPPRLPPNT